MDNQNSYELANEVYIILKKTREEPGITLVSLVKILEKVFDENEIDFIVRNLRPYHMPPHDII